MFFQLLFLILFLQIFPPVIYLAAPKGILFFPPNGSNLRFSELFTCSFRAKISNNYSPGIYLLHLYQLCFKLKFLQLVCVCSGLPNAAGFSEKVCSDNFCRITFLLPLKSNNISSKNISLRSVIIFFFWFTYETSVDKIA